MSWVVRKTLVRGAIGSFPERFPRPDSPFPTEKSAASAARAARRRYTEVRQSSRAIKLSRARAEAMNAAAPEPTVATSAQAPAGIADTVAAAAPHPGTPARSKMTVVRKERMPPSPSARDARPSCPRDPNMQQPLPLSLVSVAEPRRSTTRAFAARLRTRRCSDSDPWMSRASRGTIDPPVGCFNSRTL